MHIMFFTDNFPPEGNAIASRVFERACYWVKWGHQVTVITSVPNFPEGKVYPGYKNRWYQVEMMQGIRVVRVKTFIAKNKGFLLRTLDFLSYIVPAFNAGWWQTRPDVIAATTPQFFVGFTAWMLAVVRRMPFVLEVADIWPASIVGVGAMKKSLLIRSLEKLELFLYRRATAIAVLTAAFKLNLTARGIDANKISVVINGVELSRYTPQPRDYTLARAFDIPDNTLVVGYLGTHGMAHALKNALDAAHILRGQPQILFLFVGAGAERDELIDYAAQLKLDNVKFLPAQPKELMPRLWSLCDIALIHLKNDPVFAEVIPSKIFEAMGMGVPVLLVAPQGEASRIVVSNQIGVWVEAQKPELLAEAVLRCQDPVLRKKYAETARKCAYLYSRERQAKDLLKVIRAQAPQIYQTEEYNNE